MNTTHNQSAPKLIAIAAVTAILAGCAPNESPAPKAQAVFVTAVKLDSGHLERVLTGSVRPRIESDLAFRTGGKVLMRLVDVGQTVRAGQVIARLDPADYELAAQAASEQQRAAQVDAEQSASDAARFGRLAADGSVGTADLERQRARADAAQARLEQASRQTALARNRLGYAVLTAPFDGVVTAVRFESGQVVAEGQPVLSMAKPGELEVVADIPEGLALLLKSASFSARGWEGQRAAQPLVLRELAPIASPQTRTFRARLAVHNPKAVLDWRMGSTVELVVERAGERASAEIPVPALVQTPEKTSVWIVDPASGALRPQAVTVIAQTTDRVRVIGLPEGALVVSVGAQKLDASVKVRPVERPLDAPLNPAALPNRTTA